MLGSGSHHLLHALLTVTRKDGGELLEVLYLRIAYCLHVCAPFRSVALPQVLGCL